MITCPNCGKTIAEGRFCERCGEPIADVCVTNVESKIGDIEARVGAAASKIRDAEARIERECDRVETQVRRAAASGEPTLELDRLCPLFENMTGTLRFRFSPGGAGLENVVLTFANEGCAKKMTHRILRARQAQEFSVQFPPQGVGMQTWQVTLECVSAVRKRMRSGDVQVLVKPVESRKRGSDNFNIRFETHVGNVGPASDVVVHSREAEGLGNLISATNPFEEMNRAFMSDKRQWTPVTLSDADAIVDLPPLPSGAQTEHIALTLGGKRIHFFAQRQITFGRRKETNDIALRPPAGADEQAQLPYLKVSRDHCFFEHAGVKVLVTDGRRDARGVLAPSSGGTYWNSAPVSGSIEWGDGTSGTISFGEAAFGDTLALDVQVRKNARACATCPHANTRWCENGARPSLLLKRRDGVPEMFVGLWSCFDLAAVDASFAGVIILRKEGAFAYRRSDGRSGWLVPGATVQTDFGPVTIE